MNIVDANWLGHFQMYREEKMDKNKQKSKYPHRITKHWMEYDSASFLVSTTYVTAATDTSRQRHAPLYGRFVVEEELPSSHQEIIQIVSFVLFFDLVLLIVICKHSLTAVKSYSFNWNQGYASSNTNQLPWSFYCPTSQIKCRLNQDI